MYFFLGALSADFIVPTLAGLYLHLPFCSQRCTYCDFYFVTTSRDYATFSRAMATEIEAYGRQFGRKEPVSTLYLGGGTPSLLPLDDLARLLNAVHAHFDTAHVAETTLEANPENLAGPTGLDYLRGLKSLGIDRLSVGIQSFFPEDLAFMNRAHTAAEAVSALENATRAGFDHLSVDLIFGLPDQPLEHWGANLERAVRLGAAHLATYSLTVEERTVLHKQVLRGLVTPPPDDTVRERFLFTMGYLTDRGYDHYEVCSFARPGARSRHNQGYWRHENYLGFGPSAHSLWWQTASLAHRWENVRNLARYQALLGQGELPLEAREPLALDALADEHVYLRLRLLEEGLHLPTLRSRYGFDLDALRAPVLRDLHRGGLVTRDGDTLRLTREGAVVADAVALKLIGG